MRGTVEWDTHLAYIQTAHTFPTRKTADIHFSENTTAAIWLAQKFDWNRIAFQPSWLSSRQSLPQSSDVFHSFIVDTQQVAVPFKTPDQPPAPPVRRRPRDAGVPMVVRQGTMRNELARSKFWMFKYLLFPKLFSCSPKAGCFPICCSSAWQGNYRKCLAERQELQEWAEGQECRKRQVRLNSRGAASQRLSTRQHVTPFVGIGLAILSCQLFSRYTSQYTSGWIAVCSCTLSG